MEREGLKEFSASPNEIALQARARRETDVEAESERLPWFEMEREGLKEFSASPNEIALQARARREADV